MLLTPVLGTVKVVNINSGTDVNLYSQAGSPAYPLYEIGRAHV